jgi:hypothetical protein
MEVSGYFYTWAVLFPGLAKESVWKLLAREKWTRSVLDHFSQSMRCVCETCVWGIAGWRFRHHIHQVLGQMACYVFIPSF